KGYFGFDISGTIPFHRPTKWVQYRLIELSPGAFVFPGPCQCSKPKKPQAPAAILFPMPL
ncbi:hypothetical protein, partial [Citrobacter freundii]|uniref:hypothetical protein n=1 Tax=Citrobacter freundii TaxID=546 RepID=UPI001F14A43C